MGGCIGRCFCEIGKCFCCDCVILGTNIRDIIFRRRHNRTKPSQIFSLRKASSSATVEFENLMFEFDLPHSSTSVKAMQPKSVSSWMALRDKSKQKERNGNAFRNQFTNPLSISFNAFNSEINFIDKSEDMSNELPIIDSLLSQTIQMRSKTESQDLKDRISLGGASSMGELQWENELMNYEFSNDGSNGTELEWDHYEEHSIALQNETDQLITEIEELTKSSLNPFE